MTLPDLINGAFEAIGGLYGWKNVRMLLKDKRVHGVAVDAVFVFTLWGFWNLYYYPHLHQWLSVTGGIVIVLANAAWVGLALYYRRHSC